MSTFTSPPPTAPEHLSRGDVVIIKGERGHFRFIETVEREGQPAWVTVYGGSKDPNGLRQYRSFTPDRVRKHPNPPQERP